MEVLVSVLICFMLFIPVVFHMHGMCYYTIPNLQRQIDDLKRELEEMKKQAEP